MLQKSEMKIQTKKHVIINLFKVINKWIRVLEDKIR